MVIIPLALIGPLCECLHQVVTHFLMSVFVMAGCFYKLIYLRFLYFTRFLWFVAFLPAYAGELSEDLLCVDPVILTFTGFTVQ